MEATKFKVNAPSVTVLRADGISETIKEGNERKTQDYDIRDLMMLSTNGKKGKDKDSGKETWVYKPSIEFIEGEAPKKVVEEKKAK